MIFRLNKAGQTEINNHLLSCNSDFLAHLCKQIDVNDYSKKIVENSMQFEAWADDLLIGLVAVYCNDKKSRSAFITSVSVLQSWQGKGVAFHLLESCIKYVTQQNFISVELEVETTNTEAIKLYTKMGFIINRVDDQVIMMYLDTGQKNE